MARQLYAEIASIEQQHVTQYESIVELDQSWMEQWLMHEPREVYNRHGCVQQETNPRIEALWERFLDCELGHLQYVMGLFKDHERRDPMELIGSRLPDMIPFESQRDFVRETLLAEVDLRARGEHFVPAAEGGEESRAYRDHMDSEGSPSAAVAEGYRYNPGTELRPPADT